MWGVAATSAFRSFQERRGSVGVLRVLTYQPRDFTQEEVDLLNNSRTAVASLWKNASFWRRSSVRRALKKSNEHKDELLDVMARPEEELSRLNAGLERESPKETEHARKSQPRIEILKPALCYLHDLESRFVQSRISRASYTRGIRTV